MDRMKGAALGVGLAIVSLAIAGGAALLAIVSARLTEQYGPVCEGAIIVSVALLVGGLLGAQLLKDV